MSMKQNDRMDLSQAFSGFHRLDRAGRLERIAATGVVSDAELEHLADGSPRAIAVAESLVENAIGVLEMPLGVATNFRIDGVDRFVPMAVEETSIIAAASAAAKWLRAHGEVTTECLGRLVVGQVQIPTVRDPVRARMALLARRPTILERANAVVPGLVERGGGFRDATVRLLEREDGNVMLVLHLLLDPCDAMGANLLNQACEALRPDIERWTGERVGLCILSNLADSRVFRATVRLQGVDAELARRIEEASLFAEIDPYRAATHNKGILNGVDALLVATGNDWRAVEAGAHAFASRTGRYAPLSRWRADGTSLEGVLEMPVACGTVGGATRVHPTAAAALRLLGAASSDELARVVVAVGLVQNLGALRALCTDGIVKGHMRLHASNLALAAGATAEELPDVQARLASQLAERGSITERDAQRIVEELRTPDRAAGGARPISRRAPARMLSLLLLAASAALVSAATDARAQEAPEPAPVRLVAVGELGFLSVLDHRVQFGRSGSHFDYVDEGAQDRLFPAIRMSIEAHAGRHQLIFLYQPLELATTTRLRRDVRVDDVVFEAGTPMKLVYGFPFYRLTYQYDLLPSPDRELSVGLALQLRNATIDFQSADGTQLASNGGVGPVPLLAARGRWGVGQGMWLGFETVGFYAPVSFINGDDNDVIGAILDASVRFGVALPRGAEAFLNVRYLGGGAQGDDDDANPPDDGYTRNWLHFLFVTVGASIGTPG